MDFIFVKSDRKGEEKEGNTCSTGARPGLKPRPQDRDSNPGHKNGTQTQVTRQGFKPRPLR